MIPFIWHIQNYWDRKQISGCKRLEERDTRKISWVMKLLYNCGSDYIAKVLKMYIKNGGERRICIYKLHINLKKAICKTT